MHSASEMLLVSPFVAKKTLAPKHITARIHIHNHTLIILGSKLGSLPGPTRVGRDSARARHAKVTTRTCGLVLTYRRDRRELGFMTNEIISKIEVFIHVVSHVSPWLFGFRRTRLTRVH